MIYLQQKNFLIPGIHAFDAHLRGPSFVMEPPSKLEFSNSSGGWLDCSASGSPQPTIDWLSVDGTSVGDVGGVRRVLRNGTLVLLPFPASAYRQDIHSTIYRCVASNTVGRVISRDVQVRAGNPFILFFYDNRRPQKAFYFLPAILHLFLWADFARNTRVREKQPCSFIHADAEFQSPVHSYSCMTSEAVQCMRWQISVGRAAGDAWNEILFHVPSKTF